MVGNKNLVDSLVFLLKKASLLILLIKAFELFIFYYASIFISRGKRAFKTLKELSEIYGVPIETSYDINRFFKSGDELSDVVLFSISYYQIVNKKTLALFRDAYNIHPAPLPEGMGLFPSFWLLLYPTESGRYYQTIHRMVEEIDGGIIVAQGSEKAPQGKRSSANYMSIVTKIGCTLLENLDFSNLEKNTEVEHYISGKNTYYSYPKTKDVLLFWKKGNCPFHLSDIRQALYKS